MRWQHWLSRLTGKAPQHAFADMQPVAGQLQARQANFLVLDVETSGLDARQHHMVSAGWVCIDQLQLKLNASFYCTVRPAEDVSLGQSAVIHGLHQADLASGLTEAELLTVRAQLPETREQLARAQNALAGVVGGNAPVLPA